ncbi:MAG: bacterio-opsin activator, partial [Halobacteriales archaeon]
MPILTEVRFAHENGALADTLARLPECTVSVIQETSTDPEGKLYFMEFECEADDIEAVLEADDTVSQVRPMPGFEQQDLWGVAFAPGATLMAPRVTSQDGFVLEAHSTAVPDWDIRGWHERWLLPDRGALQDIWQYAREAGFV